VVVAGSYIAQDLNTLGGTNSYGYGLNDLGDVVGESFVNPSLSHAYLYHSGAMTDLGTLTSTAFNSSAMGINNAMQIAGFSYFFNGYNTVPHAFRMSAPGGVPGAKEDLGTLGGSYSWATGINNAGVVVGKTYDSNYSQRGFTYDTAIHDMGNAGYPSAMVEATAINDSGQVSGYAHMSSSTPQEAFRWQGGAYTGLGRLDSTLYSWGYGISNNGVVVGASNILPTGSGDYHAVRFNAGGTPVDLGSLGPHSNFEGAYGINSAGVIVGQSSAKAFIYQNGQMTDLNTLTTVSGYTLSMARGINKYGQIVADGYDAENHLHAFLLTPLGFVKNAGFLGGNLDGWNIIKNEADPSQATVIQLSGGNYVAELTTGSPVSIWQDITTPSSAFDLKFDYQFETTTGTLAVYLNSVLLGSIDAPTVLPGSLATMTIHVTDSQFFGLTSAPLEFKLDGVTGSDILLDEITTSPVPEPGVMSLLIIGFAGLLWRFRKTAGPSKR
jgi:probable HAF family extracellular repeat protein